MALSGYCMDASSRRDIYMDLMCSWYALDGYYGLQSTEVECSQLSQGIKIILSLSICCFNQPSPHLHYISMIFVLLSASSPRAADSSCAATSHVASRRARSVVSVI